LSLGGTGVEYLDFGTGKKGGEGIKKLKGERLTGGEGGEGRSMVKLFMDRGAKVLEGQGWRSGSRRGEKGKKKTARSG